MPKYRGRWLWSFKSGYQGRVRVRAGKKLSKPAPQRCSAPRESRNARICCELETTIHVADEQPAGQPTIEVAVVFAFYAMKAAIIAVAACLALDFFKIIA
jgi:hypothetical protein